MRITSSTVAMSSARQQAHFEETRSTELVTTSEQAATLEFSKEGENLWKQMEDNIKQVEEERKERQEKAMASLISRQTEQSANTQKTGERVKTQGEIKVEILKKMLDALKRMKRDGSLMQSRSEIDSLGRELRAASRPGAQARPAGNTGTVAAAQTGSTQWVKTTVKSSFVCEMEYTAYQAAGVARTADGREINFGVTVEMSRAFCQKYESLVQEPYICTDPLVINLDAGVASVTDQKFLFDLDADGKEEMISFAGQGSGFLALDKNGDGKINDGSELFGTKSGNGFADLAKYDRDGNGWIDEGDEVFESLKIWTKDEEGRDRLIGLKEAGVGAIYLGYTDTQFSLNNMQTNQTNAVIRSTGIYLKENGGTGTVQHVDLVV
ncbi:MAG: hypothetical protein HDR26_00430 [Lachnospiraceae bacterium]|nr:hypothetical protein [Lachnospiraceae bacterium]